MRGNKLHFWVGLLRKIFQRNKMREITEEEKFAKYVAETEHKIKVLRSQADVAWGRGRKEESSSLHDEARELSKKLLEERRARLKGRSEEL